MLKNLILGIYPLNLHLSFPFQKFALCSAGALLEMALINWAFQRIAGAGFIPITTPDLVRASVLEKCGFQPRAENTQVRRRGCGAVKAGMGVRDRYPGLWAGTVGLYLEADVSQERGQWNYFLQRICAVGPTIERIPYAFNPLSDDLGYSAEMTAPCITV